MTVERAQLVLQRWENKRYYGDEYNRTLMLSSIHFRKYPLNIFLLNKFAIRIQHAYFGIKAGTRKIQGPHLRRPRTVCHSFIETKNSSGSKSAGLFTKPQKKKMTLTEQQYQQQEIERKEREQRIVESRKKYGSSSRKSFCSTTTAKSRPSTAEKYKKKVKPNLVKQPTITDTQLQSVMNVAWAKAETAKQKKLKMMHKPKKANLRSQDSINEEILVNQIVRKAYVEASEIKKERAQEKAQPKPPVLHSQESIQEAQVVTQIVKNAWNHVEKERSKSGTKIPRIKKQPLRSQESINEEKVVGQILHDAFDKAEELKKQTQKMRKQAELNRKRPKLHSQKSIQEELAVKSIVNKAWKEVHEDTVVKNDLLHNICENDMENESSFDDSDSEAPTPKIQSSVEKRQSRAQATKENEPSRKVRRSRANRKGSQDMTSKSSKGQYYTNQSSGISEITNKSPFKESDQNNGKQRQQEIKVCNLDPNFNEEDLLISPVKENRHLLTADYLDPSY